MLQSERQKQLTKKLVSNAKAVISNQVTIPLGVHKINKVLYWMNQIERVGDDYNVFLAYGAESTGLPIGTERLSWNIEELIKLEAAFEQINLKYKDEVLRTCKRIIDKYKDEVV